jgi:glycosyltransferase involved in cell wall biosynthesis
MHPTEEPRLRVLALIDTLAQGGAERSLVEQSVALRDHGIDVTIFTLRSTTGGFHNEAEHAGLPVEVASAQTFLNRVREVRRLSRDYDVVHTTLFESDIIGRIAAVGTGRPVLTSLVNTKYAVDGVAGWKRWVVRSLDRWTARHLTDRFHAITDVVANQAESALGIDRRKLAVVPRGRDPKRLGTPSASRRRSVRQSLGIDDQTTVYINVGRHEAQKDHSTLIRAAAILRERGHDFVVLVAGRTGNKSQELEGLLNRLGLEANIRLLGFRSDVPDLLVAADCFVFPSLYEGLGGALLEAMALRVPIVATSIPTTIEVVGEAAALVPPGDEAAVAEAMESITRPGSGAGRAVEAAYERFQHRFAFESVVVALADLYREVARVGRGRQLSSKSFRWNRESS